MSTWIWERTDQSMTRDDEIGHREDAGLDSEMGTPAVVCRGSV